MRTMDKERLERIGKFLNDRIIIHRNVENNTPWTTEEKMIQELYDNYLDILIKYKKQKEVIDKSIDFIKNGDLLYLANKNSVVYRNNIEIRAVADRLNNLLQILEDKEVSE